MSSLLRVRLVAAVVAVLTSVPVLARADPAAPSEPSTADALFRQGRQAAERGEWAAACDHFTRSQRLDPAPGTTLNLAVCEEKLGWLSAAWAHAHEVSGQLTSADPRAAVAAELITRLNARVARLRVVLDEATPETRVMLDGRALRAVNLGQSLPVDPGEHRVEVIAPGRASSIHRVRLIEGQEATQHVAPGASGPPARPAAVSAGPSGPSRGWAWVALGVGGAGLATAVVTGVMASSKDTADDRRTLSTVSTVSLLAGLAGVGTGVALLVWRRGDTGVSLAPTAGGLAAGYRASFSSF